MTDSDLPRDVRTRRARLPGAGAILAFLLLAATAAVPALAAQYPPACTDSIGIWDVCSPTAACHPASGDTIWVGVGGVVTAIDTKPPGVGFWMQLSGGGPYSGIRVFTANTNWPVRLGDSVIVRPSRVDNYGLALELTALEGAYGSDLQVFTVASGLTLPAFHEGSAPGFDKSPANAAMQPWLNCLVRCAGPLRVARVTGLGAYNFIVVDGAGCTGAPCDSVLVDGDQLFASGYSIGPPALGSVLQEVRGVASRTSAGYRILMRDEPYHWTPTGPETWGSVKARYRR